MRKWRVVVSYLDENRTGQTTLQIRLRGEGFTTLFTMPWSQINSVPMEEESNWFIADTMVPQNFQSLCSARLISPPGLDHPGKIYSITLEAWDFIKKDQGENYSYEDTLLASTRLLRPMGQSERELLTPNYSKEEAQAFAMEVVESSLVGDLSFFYRSLDTDVYSLNNGKSYSKFIVAPPEGVNPRWTMDDYTKGYDFKLYEYAEYIRLFPQWAESGREFVPAENCYLFIGNRVKEGASAIFSQEDMLIFMVSKKGNDWKVVARPEL